MPYIVTTQGASKGFYRVVNKETGQTHSTHRTKKSAVYVAGRLNSDPKYGTYSRGF